MSRCIVYGKTTPYMQVVFRKPGGGGGKGGRVGGGRGRGGEILPTMEI